MKRTAYPMLGLVLLLTLILARGGGAQSHSPQHHPGGTPASQAPAATTDAKANEVDDEDEQAPMEQMQGMMEQMQDMMRQMQSMMGQGGMMRPGGMMGHGSMMLQRHLEHLGQQLKLSDEQRVQAQALLLPHAKEVIRLQAEMDTLALDVQQLLAVDSVDLAKVKPLLQSIAAKEADLRLAHLTARQALRTVLTPEQQQQFRSMPGHMMGASGMMGRGDMMGAGDMAGRGGMMGQGGMMGRGMRGRGGMMGCCCGGMMGCRVQP